jgi:sugar porter (SP) family MFS transporter
LIFGINLSNTSPVLNALQGPWALSDWDVEVGVSAVVAGAAVASTFTGFLADRFGRRLTILWFAALVTVASLLSALCSSIFLMSLVRLLLGVGVGAITLVVPIYAAETAPVALRGRLTAMFQVSITIGILVAYLTSVLVDHNLWRVALAIGGVPSVLILLCQSALIESPAWKPLDTTASPLLAAADTFSIDQPADSSAAMSFATIATEYRSCLLLAILLPVCQQLCGINAIILYAPQILDDAGFGTSLTLGSILTSAWNFVTTLVSLPLVDSLGRRPLLISGFALVAIGNLLAGWGFADHRSNLCVVGLVVFLLGFEVGPGPLYYVVTSELFEPRVKARLNGLSNALVWGMNLVISLFYLSVSTAIGAANTFFIFMIVSCIGVAVCFALVPETKGRDLSAIHASLRKRAF